VIVTRPVIILVRVLAVAAIGAMSGTLLHLDERGGLGAALAGGELLALVAALAWPGRVSTTIALALPAAVAVGTQELLLQVAWLMWSATVIGLANLVRGVRAPSALPPARSF
jgi:hypothetical protein